MSNKVKEKLKRLMGKPNLRFASTDYTKSSGALKVFVERHSSFLLNQHHLEKRSDNSPYSNAIAKMEPDYNFFNSDIYTRNPKQKAIFEYDNFHSGTPMEYRAFPGSMRAVKKVLKRKNLYWYPRSAGGYYAQQSIVDYLIREGFSPEPANLKNGGHYDGIGVDNVVFACSTTHAYSLILSVIAEPGDIVLMTAPNYGLFAIISEMGNYRTELLDLHEKDDWLVNPDALAKKIDTLNAELASATGKKHRVAAFLNLNPHNPTGKVLNHKNIDVLRRMGEVCKERDVFVIDDLVYRDLTYDLNDLAVPLAIMPDFFDSTISLFGLSKAYGLASFRAAVIVAPRAVAEVLAQKIHDTMDSMPVLQVASVSGAFNGSNRRYREYKKYMQKQIREYQYRYELIYALVYGVKKIKDLKKRRSILRTIDRYVKASADRNILYAGCKNLKIRAGTEPESGFFTVFDFTELKGKLTPFGNKIKSERDLLEYFFKSGGLTYLMGGNICWPKSEEMVGRISFGISRKAIVQNMLLMNKAIRKLK